MMHCVTLADRAYLLKALCLFHSYMEHGDCGRFWFFARDRQTADLLRRIDLRGAIVVDESEYETPALRAVKGSRSPLEYACTAKPIVLRYVLQKANPGDWATWLDGDMFFFQSADQLLPALQASVLLTSHRFTPRFRDHQSAVGAYNAGLVAFRKTPVGVSCLDWWAQRCLEWCGAIPEVERYTDQKYLESFGDLFPEVGIISSFGVNAAPWNTIEGSVRRRGTDVLINGDPLVVYHFQGLRIIQSCLVDLYVDDRIRLPIKLKHLVYWPYLQALREVIRCIRAVDPGYRDGFASGWRQGLLGPLRRLLLRRGNMVVA